MIRVLELYAGIGGLRKAVFGRAQVVGAIEQSPVAAEAYRQLHGEAPLDRNLERLSIDALAAFDADLWWMSPPCQPFTRRGRARDLDDPRTASFLHLLHAVTRVQPSALALENVPEFLGSKAHHRLRDVLDRADYHVWEGTACPTDLGIPNRRRRAYVIASRAHAVQPRWPTAVHRPLRAYVLDEPAPRSALYLPPDWLRQYRWPVSVVRADDPDAIAECFTAGYGRRPVFTGSLLRTEHGVRRFAPSEILDLLGFGTGLTWSSAVSLENAYRLVGNSLSVPMVRGLLADFFCAT